MTRAYTIRGRQTGYDGVLSVGRVQTPVLGLIVRRDLEIEHFQPKDFFEVLAWINPENKEEKLRRNQPHFLVPYGNPVKLVRIIKMMMAECFPKD